MRHIAPAVPAVYVIALCLLAERERPVLQFLCAAAILIAAVTGAFHLMVPEFDEMMTLGMIAGLLFS